MLQDDHVPNRLPPAMGSAPPLLADARRASAVLLSEPGEGDCTETNPATAWQVECLSSYLVAFSCVSPHSDNAKEPWRRDVHEKH